MRVTSSLRYLGRMTLTIYILQSIIGTLFFLPILLNLGKVCGGTVSLLISLLFVYLQIMFCKWWLSSHKQGPLEWTWHKLTWMNLRKNNKQ